MTSNIVRTSVFGRLVYKYSKYKYFSYPEERPDYDIPKQYLDTEQIVIDWEQEDPTHPRNWPLFERLLIQIQITLLTFFAYIGGPIYAPATETIMEHFNVSYVVATFPLCFYIIGYGTSQMYFSPMSEQMSEQPSIGRAPVYAASGIFASSAQPIGAASYADVTLVPYIPTALIIWGFAVFCGPALGPLVAVELMKTSWRNIFWFMFATNGFITVWMFFGSAETNDQTLLYWKARRLRRITGNDKIVAKCEFNEISIGKLLAIISVRAFEILIKEPIALFMGIYQGLTYGCLYLWFEGFPIAYGDTYHFSSGSVAAAYISIIVGVLIGGSVYIVIVYHTFSKKILKGEQPRADAFLDTSLMGSILITSSMFIFGWTVSPKMHWFPSLIGAAIFGAGCICVLQSNLNYLGTIHPRYIASVFGGNGLIRSYVAGTFPSYAKQMFNNLATQDFPVAWGCSVLGFIFVAFNFIPFLFKRYGPQLLENSKFSGP